MGSVWEVAPLVLKLVALGRTGPSRLWRELIDRYHNLGPDPRGRHPPLFCPLRPAPPPLLACLGWTSAAWKITAQDRWIGWTEAQRRQNLPYVVHNTRFLILPGVHLPNLASRILATTCRRLSRDWQACYGHPILLAETFVDPARFAGTCYRAAGTCPTAPRSASSCGPSARMPSSA